MNTTLKKFLLCFLALCYSVGATVGNVVVLNEMLNSGDKQYQLTSGKNSRPINDSPVWTIKTHIPPTAGQSLSVHVAPSPDAPLIAMPTVIFISVEIALVYSSLELLPSKPRDPPLA